MQAMPAAPAPLHTSRVVAMSRPVRCSALISPAAAMIAVPCWSSWNTGMSISSRSRDSMMKQSGALMSSRLMPPKEGPRKRTPLMNSSTSSVSTFQVDRIDVGEALEQHRLAFHHRLGGERPEIAEAEDRRAVGDHRHHVAAGGVVEGERRVLGDRLHRHRHARRIGQRQVALGRHRLGRRDLELARPPVGVEVQGFLIGERRSSLGRLVGGSHRRVFPGESASLERFAIGRGTIAPAPAMTIETGG